MCNNNKNKNHDHHETSELNNYQERKHVNFSLESETNKAFDISLMTGTNESNKKGSEEK